MSGVGGRDAGDGRKSDGVLIGIFGVGRFF